MTIHRLFRKFVRLTRATRGGARAVWRFTRVGVESALVFTLTLAGAQAPYILLCSRLQSEKDRAQIEADIAKAEQGRAEAEAAAFKARLGALSTADQPKGTIQTDNVVIEGNYLAYMAAAGPRR